MHAYTHKPAQLFKKLRTIFFCFVLLGFFFLSQSTTNFPKGHEMHSQPGPGFYKNHASQAKPDHSEQVEGCVCVFGRGSSSIPNILFSPPDGLERNY